MARREAQHLLDRFRDACLRTALYCATVLRWIRAGAVWAIDFTNTPRPIDGIFALVLLVRDLASGRQLLAHPAAEADADTAAAALQALFLEHGPPLVLKSGGGGHFRAGNMVGLLAAYGVRPLVSPPYTPRYNGSVEAGIGSLKWATLNVAARNGRAGAWRSDDLEEAILLANDTMRPSGPLGPTPNQVWRDRVPIGTEERVTFLARAAALEQELLACGRSPASASRDATRHALDEYGILEEKKERIRLPKRALMRARIP